jgi:threonine dehydrogenase-like Zn-dependent dehydrogenase
MRGDVIGASAFVGSARGKGMYKPGDIVEIVNYPCESWNGLAIVTGAEWRADNKELVCVKQIPFAREFGGVGGFFAEYVRLVVDGSEIDRG